MQIATCAMAPNLSLWPFGGVFVVEDGDILDYEAVLDSFSAVYVGAQANSIFQV